MADFTLIVGTHKSCVPSALAPDGTTAVPYPVGTTFAWSASDPAITFDDPTNASPVITASAVVTDVVVTMDVVEDGFPHSKTHTVDAIAAPVDSIGTVDFTIQ